MPSPLPTETPKGAFTRITAAHSEGLPRVTVEWRDLGVTATSGCCKKSHVEVLNGVNATARPGRLTLVIGNPGGGKSTLLRTAAQLPLAGSTVSAGRALLKVDGASAEEQAEMATWKRLAALSTQFDHHLGRLTVEETLSFAQHWQQPVLSSVETGLTAAQVGLFLGLDRAMQTRLGTETVRGVSGGEARRVSVGEALVGPARVWLLDSFSDGLDAARTKAITSGLLRPFAQHFGGTVVCVLQQPAQELYELFDDVILLRDGRCLYSGKREDCAPFFEKDLGLVRAGGISDPEFLANVCSEPGSFEYNGRRRRDAPMASVRLTAEDMAAAFASAAKETVGGGSPSAGPPLAANGKVGTLSISKARSIFSGTYARGMCFQACTLSHREMLNTLRDVQFLVSHFVRALIMALVIGSLYSGLSQDDFVQRIALLFFTALNLAMGGAAELPVALANKLVVDRQSRGLHMYYPWLYAVCVSLVFVPVAALEVILFCAPTYYIVGFADDTARFFVFFGLVMGLVLAMIGVFRLIAWIAGQLEVALAGMVPFIAFFTLFSGFLATKSNLGWGIVGQWLFWVSPIAWTIRGLAVNEFTASEYDTQVELRGAPGRFQRKGTAYLDAYEIDADESWVYWGFVYVFALAIFVLALGALSFQLKVLYEPLGTRRLSAAAAAAAAAGAAKKTALVDAESGEAASARADGDAKAAARDETSGASSSPGKDDDAHGAAVPARAPVTPLSATATAGKTLAFRDLVFDVRLVGAAAKKAEARRQKQGGEGGEEVDLSSGAVASGHKRLLNRISGVARPGRVLALCGESGAGKTTLLNTLAGRTVTQGHVKGTIMLGDHLIKASQLRSRVGYVEQFDRHLTTTTVREALVFSAWMRQGAKATQENVKQAVDEALELLELGPVEHRLIGDEKTGEGLSRGERKRLTIGVELVANPGVLFLDEPTTALSATQARDVARVIRRVASSGRTVICTLHQPSVGVWSNMDDLLLLARGGYTVFFGEVGESSKNMVSYLSSLPGSHPLPPGMNPADYMLDVIGSEGKGEEDAKLLPKAGAEGGAEALRSVTSAAATAPTTTPSRRSKTRGEELLHVFLSSTAKEALDRELDDKGIARDSHKTRMGESSAASSEHGAVDRLSLFMQFWMLLRRHSLDFLRDTEFGVKRAVMFAILALISGGVFFDLANKDTDQAGVLSLVGGIVMSIIFVGAIAANTTAVAMHKRRPSYIREQASHMYSPVAYSSAVLLSSMPWTAVFVVVFLSIYSAMIGYDFSNLFGIMFLIIFLFANNMGCIAMALGYLADTPQLVASLVTVVMSLSAMFGGFFVPRADIPPGWIWMHYIAPMAFPLEAAVPAPFVCPEGREFTADAAGPCATIDAFDNGKLLRGVKKLTFVEDFYGIDASRRWMAVGITIGYGAVVFLLFNLVLWRLRAKAV